MNNKLPAIAVYLAAWNGMKYIGEQVDSILAQVGVEVSLHVSIDRSDDGTENWFRQRAEHDTRITLLPYGERFGGAAPNFFRLLREVDCSRYDYVSLADQDDIWLPDKLKRASDVLVATCADGYSSDVLAFWESGRTRYIKKSWPQRQWDYLFESAGPGCTFVLSRALASDLQQFVRQHESEMIGIGLHDWFTYAWARTHGYTWQIDEYAGMNYRQHGENQVGVNRGFRAFMYRAKQVLNGWGLSQTAKIAELIGLAEHSFVRHWRDGGRMGMLWLALRSGECRRRPRDRIWFALSCIILALVGRRV
jgi:rhamnosyltransferase